MLQYAISRDMVWQTYFDNMLRSALPLKAIVKKINHLFHLSEMLFNFFSYLGSRPAFKEELDLFYKNLLGDKSEDFNIRNIQSYVPVGGNQPIYGPFQNLMQAPLGLYPGSSSEAEKMGPDIPVNFSFNDKSVIASVDPTKTNAMQVMSTSETVEQSSSTLTPVSLQSSMPSLQMHKPNYPSFRTSSFQTGSPSSILQTQSFTELQPPALSITSDSTSQQFNTISEVVSETHVIQEPEKSEPSKSTSTHSDIDSNGREMVTIESDKDQTQISSYSTELQTELSSKHMLSDLIKEIKKLMDNGHVDLDKLDSSAKTLLEEVSKRYQKFEPCSNIENDSEEVGTQIELAMEIESDETEQATEVAEPGTVKSEDETLQGSEPEVVNVVCNTMRQPKKTLIRTKRTIKTKRLTNNKVNNFDLQKATSDILKHGDVHAVKKEGEITFTEVKIPLHKNNENSTDTHTESVKMEVNDKLVNQNENTVGKDGIKSKRRGNKAAKLDLPKTDKKSNRFGMNRNLRLHNCHRRCPVFPTDLNSEFYSPSENGYYCPDCKFIFYKKNKLIIHKKLKVGGLCVSDCIYCDFEENKDVFKCLKCPKVFETKDLLDRHIDKHNTEMFNCMLCEASYCTVGDLKFHMTVDHTDEIKQTYLCDLCGSKFKEKKILNAHRKYVHTDERPESCSTCGRKFKTKSQLKNHLITHMSATDSHLSCEVCGKLFTRVASLKEHVRRHKKEFTFYCEVCKKGFYKKHGMEEHMRIHTGDKPYDCKFCDFKCALSCNLVKHMRVHQKQEPVKV